MKAALVHILFFLVLVGNLTAQTEYKKFYFDNGVVSSEGTMVSGKPNGYWKTYYPDGGLKTEGNRREFKLDSVWKFYREDSTLERTINYREDLKFGKEQLFSKKGIIAEEYTNENNVRNGEARFYYPDGKLWKVLQFENNKEEGKATEYGDDGRIITKLTYKNGFIFTEERINRYNSEGRRTGIWQDLYENQVLKEEGPWTNGLRNGVFKFKNGEFINYRKSLNGVRYTAYDDNWNVLLSAGKQRSEPKKFETAGTGRTEYSVGVRSLLDDSVKVWVNNALVSEGRDYTVNY